MVGLFLSFQSQYDKVKNQSAAVLLTDVSPAPAATATSSVPFVNISYKDPENPGPPQTSSTPISAISKQPRESEDVVDISQSDDDEDESEETNLTAETAVDVKPPVGVRDAAADQENDEEIKLIASPAEVNNFVGSETENTTLQEVEKPKPRKEDDCSSVSSHEGSFGSSSDAESKPLKPKARTSKNQGCFKR